MDRQIHWGQLKTTTGVPRRGLHHGHGRLHGLQHLGRLDCDQGHERQAGTLWPLGTAVLVATHVVTPCYTCGPMGRDWSHGNPTDQ